MIKEIVDYKLPSKRGIKRVTYKLLENGLLKGLREVIKIEIIK